MAYVFYDTETTGIETAFDQILQFGAIRTDDDFNELERFNIRCRLLPHIVPAPSAIRITKVNPDALVDPALPSHYEAIRQIRSKLSAWSPAVFIGYNSIDFDESLLRQAFFQTLHPAYLTNTNGNSRADMMRVVHAASVYAPNSIAVPLDEKGRQTFRLDRLAPANGYVHVQAHEALADVAATIHIARLIRDRAPDVWQTMERVSRKDAVIEYVRAERMLSMTERNYGRTNSWVVAGCGVNPENNGQLAVFDLYYNPDQYRTLSSEDLVAVLNGSPKVIRALRANAQPILMPADVAPETAQALQIPFDERERRAEVIRGDAEFKKKIGRALALRFADKKPSAYIEERIYGGFPNAGDQALMERFHSASWSDRVALAARIEDERIREFAYRLIYFGQPDVLPNAKAAELKGWLAERLLSEDDNVPWRTVPKALRQTDDLLKEANGDDARLLGELKDFLNHLVARLSSV
jgi:exodeoxyribonuclease I